MKATAMALLLPFSAGCSLAFVKGPGQPPDQECTRSIVAPTGDVLSSLLFAAPSVGLFVFAASCDPRSDVINCSKATGPAVGLGLLGTAIAGAFAYSAYRGFTDTAACRKLDLRTEPPPR
jgi:hypothetical protein